MPLFQYISCYGLSSSRKTNCDSFLKFQYISCYGLSLFLTVIIRSVKYFNTSHVTVYHVNPSYQLFTSAYFNTSHVTVYRINNFYFDKIMEDFNTSHVTVYLSMISINVDAAPLFQYISCYGLSRSEIILTS